MVAADRIGLVIGWTRTTYRGTLHSWEDAAMTDLQIYLLVAPFILLLVAGVGAWLGLKLIARAENARRRAR